MTTFCQTVQIVNPITLEDEWGYEKRPICPRNFGNDEECVFTIKNGVEYTWYIDGSITVYENPNIFKYFPKKPTLQEVVNEKGAGQYTRFFGNGSVLERTKDGNTWEWGAELIDDPCETCRQMHCDNDCREELSFNRR